MPPKQPFVLNITPTHPGDVKGSRVPTLPEIPANNVPVPVPSGLKYAEHPYGGWYPFVEGRMGEWTPLLTSTGTQPNLGTTGTAFGEFSVTAGECFATFYMEFGSGGGAAGGTGEYKIEGLPFEIDLPLGKVRLPVGQVGLFDSDTSGQDYRFLVASSSTEVKMRSEAGAPVTNTVPWTWAGGDYFIGTLKFPAKLI